MLGAVSGDVGAAAGAAGAAAGGGGGGGGVCAMADDEIKPHCQAARMATLATPNRSDFEELRFMVCFPTDR